MSVVNKFQEIKARAEQNVGEYIQRYIDITGNKADRIDLERIREDFNQKMMNGDKISTQLIHRLLSQTDMFKIKRVGCNSNTLLMVIGIKFR